MTSWNMSKAFYLFRTFPAGYCGSFRVSRPTVSKVFKEAMKVNFIDYLHKLRVEQAKIFFEQENYNVPAVAQLCGYENEIAFRGHL